MSLSRGLSLSLGVYLAEQRAWLEAEAQETSQAFYSYILGSGKGGKDPSPGFPSPADWEEDLSALV